MMIQMRDKTSSPGGPTSKGGDLSCEEFQSQIPDLMGGNIHDHEHLKTCERCTALLEELEYIAEIAKGFLPLQEPPDTLWPKIEGSLQGEEAEPAANGRSYRLTTED